MKIVEIRIFNEEQFRNIKYPIRVDRPFLLIYIEGIGYTRLFTTYAFDDILRLNFDDAWSKSDKGSFTPDQAKEIKKTIDLKEWKLIWVVCDQGISRSPAVAIALDEYFNKKKSDLFGYYPNHNQYVYKMLSKELSKGGK